MKPVNRCFAFVVAVCCLLVGCASPGYLVNSGAGLQCSSEWRDFRRQINDSGIYDAQDWPLPAYPYIRLNRVATYLAQQDLTAEQRSLWLEQAYGRGKHARSLENQKLINPAELSELEDCLAAQLPGLRDDMAFWDYVRNHPYPDNYLVGRQMIGLYPVFRPFINWQAEELNEEIVTGFQHYESEFGWHYYARQSSGWKDSQQWPEWDDIRTILNPALHRDELGLPQFNEQEAQALFSYYSPVIAMEAGHPEDRIGRPQQRGGRWTTTFDPEVFTLLTTTLWQGEWMPQLVYHWWYPGRPKTGWLDIYGGELDGLIWRVTLNWEGEVLFYDSIHPCGCYHKIFPVNPVITFSGTPKGEENLVVLPVNHPGPRFRPIIQISSVAHYVVGLSFDEIANETAGGYRFTDYDELRALPADNGYLFDPSGLVPGTGRLERFLLWNTGVASPGAMRQWGHHATAFVSRRHFDDPELFSRYFR